MLNVENNGPCLAYSALEGRVVLNQHKTGNLEKLPPAISTLEMSTGQASGGNPNRIFRYVLSIPRTRASISINEEYQWVEMDSNSQLNTTSRIGKITMKIPRNFEFQSSGNVVGSRKVDIKISIKSSNGAVGLSVSGVVPVTAKDSSK